MIKHIVMWRLKGFADGSGSSKEENAKKLKQYLEALKDKISEIRHIEVGINISGSDAASDVVLYSEFDSMEDLEAYQKHPEHQKIVSFVNEIRSERRVVDYKV
ncbi:MAG TPA: Dabb family protein [Thermodesulfobacteriota bacterium]|nr:Dabb family protein [Thermodesulfobacteriota bacterium]